MIATDAVERMPKLEVVVDRPEYKISKTEIDGLLVFDRPRFPDKRGSYQELSRTDAIAEVLGRPVVIKQTSLSYNLPFGVLRGLHAEPMDKIITVLTGSVFIAIADIRPESETFAQYVTFTLDQTDPETPKKTIVVANGLANSFMTVGTQPVEYLYQVSDTYISSDGKRAVRWNDPDLNIPWPIQPAIISDDDLNKHPFLRDLYPNKFK